MVSVKHLLALAISVWRLAGQCFGDNEFECDGVPDFESEYNTLKNTYTGYDYTQLVPSENKNQSTIDRLRVQIIEELKCSYVLRAMRYYLISRKLIERDDMVTYLQENSMDRYKFVEEAKAMLSTMKNCGQLKTMDAIWWIYVYSLYVSKRMQRNQMGFVFRCDAYNSNLTNYLTKCKENNRFNNQYGDSVSFKDVTFLLSNRITFDTLLGLIDEQKETLAEQIAVNETLASPTDGTGDIFDIKRLCLNHVYEKSAVMDCLLKDFGELFEWTETRRRFMDDYSACTENKQIEIWLAGFGKLHTRIICLLKIIMLQIIWRHGTYVYDLRPHNIWDAVRRRFIRRTPLKIANMKMISQVSKFVKFVGLGEDDHFTNIEKMLNSLLGHRSQINRFYHNIEFILDELSSELYGCQRSYPKSLDSIYVSFQLNLMASIDTKLAFVTNISNYVLSEIPTIQESLVSAVVFNRYIQYNFKGVNFEVIQSFIRFTRHLN